MERPDSYTAEGYRPALDAGDWETVREVDETVAQSLIDQAIQLEARASGKRFQAMSLCAMSATPFARPPRERCRCM